ncbi:MAG: histidine kinase [Syntrophus sp. (in: bacteria)]|nr:histidine kinase [Syntrophus sp. (in: bacteria)]
MKRPGADTLLLTGGILMTAFLLWFAVNSQLSAVPVARAMLQGLALSLGQAIDYLAARDPSLKSLADFRYRDIAYFALIDRSGRIRFHQNPELVGELVEDNRYHPAFSAAEPVENRVRLGTGEEVYECHLPLHLPGEAVVLRLVLHTWQADQVINRARTGATILLTLTVSAWVLGFLLFRLHKREARRREQMARQEQMARLGELGAVLAHEVRTPLAGIKGYAQLLVERITDERSRGFAALIVQETVRLEGLVNDLLDYARQDDPGDGCALLDETLFYDAWNMITNRADGQSVKPELSIPSDVRVACRPERLLQLLINLFSNALQAMPLEGTVHVKVTEERERVTLKVRDTGAGFTEEAMKRAFDPFFTTRPRGSGLGLAVCRKIAEGCGGGISAANADGGGAVMTVLLPTCRERRRS